MNINGSLKIEVVTPVCAVLTAHSPYCTLPTLQGQIEILPGHIPLISALDAGELVIEVDGHKRIFYVEGGFAEVSNNAISIITDAAYGVEDFDIAAARENLKLAESELVQLERRAATERIELSVIEEHQEALRHARMRLAFGEDVAKK